MMSAIEWKERRIPSLRFAMGLPRVLCELLPNRQKRLAESGEDWSGLRDLNRVTFEFEDPLVLTLVYHTLITKFEVSGLKNKFNTYIYYTYEQPPDIHMNIDLGDGWLCEVQLMFSSVLKIKKELHTYYDDIRATEPSVILSPLFDKPKSLTDFQKDEVDLLKQLIETNKEMEEMNAEAGIFESPEKKIQYLEEENAKLKQTLENIRLSGGWSL
ncbi:hypothetical protein TrST_g8793 [Triparma strigata]|uniref:Uncharacterized protein n=1 Tax=Triparma strigata TaxID=1606541 RepID=A0A9W7C2L2_9STRA|nr:hypothetical protein TrST_g8793 [Triparma strigata]